MYYLYLYTAEVWTKKSEVCEGAEEGDERKRLSLFLETDRVNDFAFR
jgi:hypothetical protein